MRVLIIGGNRYFGLRLAKKIIANGHQLTLLNRGNTLDNLGGTVQRIKCDRSNEPEFRKALSNLEFDVVYDQICYNSHDAAVACDVLAGKTKKYIFTSTVSVYDDGINRKESEFDPFSYPIVNEAKPSNYQMGKRQAESIFHQMAKFSVLSMRLPIVLGPDDYTKRFVWHVERIKRGDEIFFPDVNAKISLVHAQDAADFLLYCLDKDVTGPINVASVEPIQLMHLFSLIEDACGKKMIIAKNESKDNHSPFGFATDSWLNVEKMLGLGFQPRAILDWVPELFGNQFVAQVR